MFTSDYVVPKDVSQPIGKESLALFYS